MYRLKVGFDFIVSNYDGKVAKINNFTLIHITEEPNNLFLLKLELEEILVKEYVNKGWTSANGFLPSVEITSEIKIIYKNRLNNRNE